VETGMVFGGLKFSLFKRDRAACGSRRAEQLAGIFEDRKGRLNLVFLSSVFGLMFKPDDILAGGFQKHLKGPTLLRNFKLTDAMGMAIQLTFGGNHWVRLHHRKKTNAKGETSQYFRVGHHDVAPTDEG
jgi:hypothetical protein